MRRSDITRTLWLGPFRLQDSFVARYPFIGTDEYYQHTVTVIWPFSRHSAGDGERLYWGLTVWLPSTCREPLREELDSLRDWDEVEEPTNPGLHVLDGGKLREHDTGS